MHFSFPFLDDVVAFWGYNDVGSLRAYEPMGWKDCLSWIIIPIWTLLATCPVDKGPIINLTFLSPGICMSI